MLELDSEASKVTRQIELESMKIELEMKKVELEKKKIEAFKLKKDLLKEMLSDGIIDQNQMEMIVKGISFLKYEMEYYQSVKTLT